MSQNMTTFVEQSDGFLEGETNIVKNGSSHTEEEEQEMQTPQDNFETKKKVAKEKNEMSKLKQSNSSTIVPPSTRKTFLQKFFKSHVHFITSRLSDVFFKKNVLPPTPILSFLPKMKKLSIQRTSMSFILFFFVYKNRAKIKKCFFFQKVRFSQQFSPKICFLCLIFVEISPKFFPCGAFA
jgi:hypothetical protein